MQAAMFPVYTRAMPNRMPTTTRHRNASMKCIGCEKSESAVRQHVDALPAFITPAAFDAVAADEVRGRVHQRDEHDGKARALTRA